MLEMPRKGFVWRKDQQAVLAGREPSNMEGLVLS